MESLGLRVGFAGDENADRKRNEKIGQGKKRKSQNVAVNGNLKDEAHEGENQAEFGKTDAEIRKELAKKKTHGTDRRDEKLLEGAAHLFTAEGESRQEAVDIEH